MTTAIPVMRLFTNMVFFRIISVISSSISRYRGYPVVLKREIYLRAPAPRITFFQTGKISVTVNKRAKPLPILRFLSFPSIIKEILLDYGEFLKVD